MQRKGKREKDSTPKINTIHFDSVLSRGGRFVVSLRSLHLAPLHRHHFAASITHRRPHGRYTSLACLPHHHYSLAQTEPQFSVHFSRQTDSLGNLLVLTFSLVEHLSLALTMAATSVTSEYKLSIWSGGGGDWTINCSNIVG